MIDIVERLKDAENATHALFNHIFQDAREEIERLRAKIEAMEKQEPVGTALLCVRCSTPFDDCHYCPACGFHTATEEYVYALPGAKGEEK